MIDETVHNRYTRSRNTVDPETLDTNILALNSLDLNRGDSSITKTDKRCSQIKNLMFVIEISRSYHGKNNKTEISSMAEQVASAGHRAQARDRMAAPPLKTDDICNNFITIDNTKFPDTVSYLTQQLNATACRLNARDMKNTAGEMFIQAKFKKGGKGCKICRPRPI